MDIRKVKKLIELLEESNIDEIEIKEGEESVRISPCTDCQDRLGGKPATKGSGTQLGNRRAHFGASAGA